MDKIGLLEWTKNWDNYLFLNSDFEKQLLERHPEAKTKVMAPPTDLTKYFAIEPNYLNGLRLIRHSSQGDAKYPKDFNEIVDKVLNIREDVNIRLMPGPSFIKTFGNRVIVHQRNIPSIEEFLKLGNCFWYKLPVNYTEGGPKVVMEAQAAGLPVIGDNHSGIKDRIIPETGWLCNSLEESLEIIKNITPDVLEKYGKKAREHARVNYNPMNWIKNILGEE
jgi:glycosyltransferase involved in cell wall biosynthesis